MRKWDWPHPKRDQTGWLRAKLVCFYDDKSAGITKARIETTTLGNIAESITEVRAAVCASAELCLRQRMRVRRTCPAGETRVRALAVAAKAGGARRSVT